MEIILDIKEFEDPRYDGFVVTTDKQTIKLGISNHSQCCEDWGYFWCNDDVQDFVGATLYGVRLTDTALNEVIMDDKYGDPYEGDTMFVNLETNRGTLQFVAYNIHNGYYGHKAIVECSQLTHDEYL